MQTIIEIGGQRYQMTRHAIARALDMGITGEDIREALRCPASIRRSPSYGHLYYNFKDFSLSVTDTAIKTVMTVLWWGDAAWRRDLARAPYPPNDPRNHPPEAPRGGAAHAAAAAEVNHAPSKRSTT